MGAQPPAETDAERARVLVIAHGQRDLEIFVGVQSAGVFEMSIAQRAGVAQDLDDFVLGG